MKIRIFKKIKEDKRIETKKVRQNKILKARAKLQQNTGK